jgi:hypothetical protein
MSHLVCSLCHNSLAKWTGNQFNDGDRLLHDQASFLLSNCLFHPCQSLYVAPQVHVPTPYLFKCSQLTQVISSVLLNHRHAAYLFPVRLPEDLKLNLH